MVNMAGGVMENAGLCLDRFGLPTIPGSAVKGRARRAALDALRGWCEAGGEPEHKPSGNDNVFTSACADCATPADMLAAIAHVFGWCELDWKARADFRTDEEWQSKRPDFAWACGDRWAAIRDAVVRSLAAKLHLSINPDDPTPWKRLPNFAGSVSFLPAYPVELGRTGKVEGLPLELPPVGKLELDVVTCHHRDYYAAKLATATDPEEPVPVVFPAAAPGHVFAFALAPLRGADRSLIQHACAWLTCGLSTFGLGAKTAAGYGWFCCGQDIQEAVGKSMADTQRRKLEEQKRAKEEEKREAEEAERQRLSEERKAATASMTEEQKADYELAQLTPDQFRAGWTSSRNETRPNRRRWCAPCAWLPTKTPHDASSGTTSS
jgi:hypothetical protein